ncbi:FAD-dependent monooxygenase [Pannus brasiliensis CCIBt3594]|uniref:FAD-dependent monooxygenase n=1 Tax=Pannus brasiliensis CCIBt3594 TaxID=1427578 RepID=A0AAW9R0H3_9CHRO
MVKVIVIGGGIGGLTLARACLDAGLAVEVYEKRPLEEMLSGPGGIFLQRNATRVYEVLRDGELHVKLYERGGTIRDGGFFSSRGKPLYLNSPKFIGADNLGVCLLRPELQRILYESLPSGTVKVGYPFENFEEREETVRVVFGNGTSVEGNVVVGADGLYSKVRARLEGAERLEPPVYSGTCCWRGYFEGSALALDRRYSWAEFWGRGDRFGYFDVGRGRFSFYAFANTPPGGNDEAGGGSLAVLKALFSNYADPVPAILEVLGDRPIYRDDIFDREPLAGAWGRGRVTLIGDAAHPVQPNLGQGGCMAIEDAYELARRLASLGREGSVPGALRQFEAGRRERVTRVFAISRQVGLLGNAEHPLACSLRNWLYRLTPAWLADRQFKWLFDYVPEPLDPRVPDR